MEIEEYGSEARCLLHNCIRTMQTFNTLPTERIHDDRQTFPSSCSGIAPTMGIHHLFSGNNRGFGNSIYRICREEDMATFSSSGTKSCHILLYHRISWTVHSIVVLETFDKAIFSTAPLCSSYIHRRLTNNTVTHIIGLQRQHIYIFRKEEEREAFRFGSTWTL